MKNTFIAIMKYAHLVVLGVCVLAGSQASVASIVSLDASILTTNNKAYFFDKEKYYRFNFQTDQVDKAADIGIDGWTALGSNINAAVMHPNGKAYFFSGDKYYRFNFQKKKVDKVGKIGVDGWRGLPSNIDAAIMHPNGKAYFFVGDKYYRFSFDKDKVDNGYPRKIGVRGWKGLPSNIDAAVMHPNGKAYFFVGDEYYRFSFDKDKVDNGYPRKIGVRGWKGLDVVLVEPSHVGEWLSRKQPNHIGNPDERTGFGDENSLGYSPSTYYTNITAPSTFAEWKHLYGFDAFTVISGGHTIPNPFGSGEILAPLFIQNNNLVNTKYFNKLDLGIGRDMHCSRFGTDDKGVACYVSNYGDLPLNSGVTEDLARTTLAKMHDINNRGATVAMIYDPAIEVAGKQVQFYIYDTGAGKPDADAGLLNDIQLDSEGAKASPGLCLSCHGGDIQDNVVVGGHFLPFDPSLFTYEETGDITQVSQESAFKKINSYVLDTEPTSAIKKLILGLYRGNDVDPVNSKSIYNSDTYDRAFSTSDASFIPEGWRNNPRKYKNVAQKYCLMCHMALKKSAFNFFQKSGDLETNLYGACNNKSMPHAEVPYNDFWRSGTGALNCP